MYGIHGVLAMGHGGNGYMWPIAQWGTGVMGHMDNGAIVYRGYEPHGQWSTWEMGAQGVWAMGHRG